VGSGRKDGRIFGCPLGWRVEDDAGLELGLDGCEREWGMEKLQ